MSSPVVLVELLESESVFPFLFFFHRRAVKVICMIKQLLLSAESQSLEAVKLLLAASIIGTTLKRAHNDVEKKTKEPFTVGLYMPYPLRHFRL